MSLSIFNNFSIFKIKIKEFIIDIVRLLCISIEFSIVKKSIDIFW